MPSSPRKDYNPKGPIKVVLRFDGSAAPNPGAGGGGAIGTITIAMTDGTSTQESLELNQPYGHSTSNSAEYLGLIGGLRAVLRFLQSRGLRAALAQVLAVGDSELVIRQMEGKYQTNAPALLVLRDIVQGLVARFSSVTFRACSRSDNSTADAFANDGRKNTNPAARAVYYPSLTNFVSVWVAGVPTLASHDMVTSGSDSGCFIDATFLRTLSDYGSRALKDLRDPYPLSLLESKTKMTILGTIVLDVGIKWNTEITNENVERSLPDCRCCAEFYVVDALPVQLHVSLRNGGIPSLPTVEVKLPLGIKFRASNVPPQFRSHPYWSSDVEFIGFGLSSFIF